MGTPLQSFSAINDLIKKKNNLSQLMKDKIVFFLNLPSRSFDLDKL